MSIAPTLPEIQKGPRFTRRTLLKTGAAGAAALVLYASEIERHWIEVSHTEIRLSGLPDALHGLRVAQLSDIHMDEYT